MLSSLASVKMQLGITDTSLDSMISQFLPQVDRLIKRWCRQELEAGTYTEYPDGNNTDRLILKQRPVNTITSVWLDADGWYGSPSGSFASTTQLAAGLDYVLVPDQPNGTSSKAGFLQRIRGVWPAAREYTRGLVYQAVVPSRGAIKVTYTAGYAAPLPDDLVLAANQGVAVAMQLRKGRRLSSESHKDYSYSVLTPADADNIIGALKALLSPYRVWRA